MQTILCIDDDPINALIIRKILQEMYAFDVAYNAEDGLKALEAKRYDLIFMDINLGEASMDGIALMQIIKQKIDKIKIIAVTAFALPEDEKKWLDIGFDGYLSKPIDEKKLHEVLKKLT